MGGKKEAMFKKVLENYGGSIGSLLLPQSKGRAPPGRRILSRLDFLTRETLAD
ncbi:TPA: hypothetical protein HA281_02480 [Candidatus Woesearchaeota archaeon]|nr:hypothetical protein [Candidatus Woesearchaeota archaeon]